VGQLLPLFDGNENRLRRSWAEAAGDVGGGEQQEHVRREHGETIDADEENQGQESNYAHRKRAYHQGPKKLRESE
jgi:hypothetical protein